MQSFRYPSSSESYILLIFLTITTITSVKSKGNMSDNTEKSETLAPTSETAAYMVYTEQPEGGPDPDSFHLSTLSSVLGSEDAAKDSLLYVYKNAATGFSANLTPEQVSELQKKPGVLQVVPSQTYQLQKGGGSTMLCNAW